ncbi:MAG: hypothetical protein KGL35_02215 [Bradyrhizobium sp.]|nr:hypothetical protein [Pseudomonadota bacterium]MDE2467574.1 hypothetical protein [Bradyrhizobium sp.]
MLEHTRRFESQWEIFLTRACIASTFVILSLLLSGLLAILACLACGLTLLVGLTCLVAKTRRASVAMELLKHIALAAIVVLASGLIGSEVGALVH